MKINTFKKALFPYNKKHMQPPISGHFRLKGLNKGSVYWGGGTELQKPRTVAFRFHVVSLHLDTPHLALLRQTNFLVTRWQLQLVVGNITISYTILLTHIFPDKKPNVDKNKVFVF